MELLSLEETKNKTIIITQKKKIKELNRQYFTEYPFACRKIGDFFFLSFTSLVRFGKCDCLNDLQIEQSCLLCIEV